MGYFYRECSPIARVVWEPHTCTSRRASIGRVDNLLVPVLRMPQGPSMASLCRTWVLANDVLGKPRAAGLVTPWLVAYPVALIVRFSFALSLAWPYELIVCLGQLWFTVHQVGCTFPCRPPAAKPAHEGVLEFRAGAGCT